MNGLKILGTLLMLVVLVSVGNVQAQDFNALLGAVEKIESHLKQLVKQEAETRTQELAKLRLELEAVKSTRSEIAPADIGSIVAELEYLRQEVSLWKSFFEQNKGALASLEGGEIPRENNDEQVEQLAERLAVLSDNVEKWTSTQYQPDRKPVSKPSGTKTTVNGRMYSHGMVDFSEGSDNYDEFALSRAYVTLKSKLSGNTSVRITSDFKSIDDKYNIILKYAYLDWQPGFSHGYAKLRFGLQATQYIDQMNKLWGRRYVEKTVGDKRKFLTSSDLGFSTIIAFGPKSKFGFASLAFLNGTSYSSVQELNSNKNINFVSLLKPFKQLPSFAKSALMIQYYSGTQNKALDDLVSVDSGTTPYDTTVTAVAASDWETKIFSVGGLLAWNSTIDVGFDLNFTTVGKGPGSDAVKKRGMSLFGAFYLTKLMGESPFMKSINFFGRVDRYDPNTGASGDSETLSIFGIESAPVKGFKVAFNYRNTSFASNNRNSNSMLYVNTLFKF